MARPRHTEDDVWFMLKAAVIIKIKNMHLIQQPIVSTGWGCRAGWDGRGGTRPITRCPEQGRLLASDLMQGKEGTCRMFGPGKLEKAADVGA